jgi:membrane dipeptidase
MPLRADDGFLCQLERYRHAGFHIVSLNIGMAEGSLLEHLRVLSFMRRWIAQRADVLRLIDNVADIEQCRRDGRLGIVFDVEGMCPVQDDLSFVQTFYELGVRWMLIAYNRNNEAGGGCLDEDCGLTDRGRRIIDEMERVGMVLCLSHTGARTAAEALEYARKPVIFSHSNAYAVAPNPRNISDELIRACADKGGVVGVNGIGLFLGGDDRLVERLVSHVRHMVDLVGTEHVGLALDYVFDLSEVEQFARLNPALTGSGGFKMVPPEALEKIVEELLRAKLTEAQIRGILGGNWLRVARETWR